MAVSGVGSGAGSESAPLQVRRPNVKKLREALASGDVDAARESFAKIMKNAKNAEAKGSEKPGFRSEFKQLVQAVDAGDMTAAQSALSSMTSERAATYSRAQIAQPFKKVTSDLRALAQAVQDGDADAAKTALAKLRAEFHGHVEHHGKEPDHPDPVTILPVPDPISVDPSPVMIQPIPQPIAVDPGPVSDLPAPSANPVLPLVR
ncbi:MAG: hypothetical protein U0132_11300 [Gemmatimonadaceae bacterium]